VSEPGATVPGVIDHFGFPVADVDASVAAYLRLFAPLGLQEAVRIPHEGSAVVGLAGPGGPPQFWLTPGGALGRELHVAFSAPDRAAVDAVYAVALEAGVEVLHAPREWPEYHPGYYGVFLRDPDGHNVEAVHHGF
jgi:catechol 2,3-dioxygenase-like lactoylglutathione lyase family enzyme